MHRLLFLSLFFWGSWMLPVWSQSAVTLSGVVRSAETGEALIGAVVWVEFPKINAVSADESGRYRLRLEPGEYRIQVKMTGFLGQSQTLSLRRNTRLDWSLASRENLLQEVNILARKRKTPSADSVAGLEKIPMKQIARTPMLFGERDVLKAFQLLPGVKSAGEGNGNFHVRGGGLDQNLILMDGAPVFNPAHLLGFFSIFNADAVGEAGLIKGNSPAQYGGRLASVLDVRMREGNAKKCKASGGLGLISSRLALEGPLRDSNTTFLLAGRRSYADLFLGLSSRYKDNLLWFYDGNLTLSHRLKRGDQVVFSGYQGGDRLGLNRDYRMDWGNRTASLSWNRVVNERWKVRTALIFSRYQSLSALSGLGSEFNFQSRIGSWGLKQDFVRSSGPRGFWRMGWSSTRYLFRPSRVEVGDPQQELRRKGWENALYLSYATTFGSRWSLESGLRLSSFSVVGAGLYQRFESGVFQDSIRLRGGQVGITRVNPEPRISLQYKPNSPTTWKMAYARQTQNIHLLSNSTTGYPVDEWIGSSYTVKPQISDQVSLGFTRSLFQNRVEIEMDLYCKSLQNQIDYRNGAEVKGAPDVESELLSGVGRAYGLEFLARKKAGRLTGWVAYTLSRTERKIAGINQGNWYLSRADRTHELALVGFFALHPHWVLSGNFVWATGNPITLPTGVYTISQTLYLAYSARNAHRLPAYHRLDLNLHWEGLRGRRWQSEWIFSLYNVYGQENPYTILFVETDYLTIKPVQITLFRWVPGITYQFSY